MKRQENLPPRPTAGFGSVPLFNQRKRNRIPLTSAPSENEFFFHSEFMGNTSPTTSANTSECHGHYQASGSGSDSAQSHKWKTKTFPASGPMLHYGQTSNRPAPGPAPGPAVRHFAPIPHPYKPGGAGSRMVAPSTPVRHQESSSGTNFRPSGCQHVSSSAQKKPTLESVFSQTSQKSIRPAISTHSEQPRPLARPTQTPKGPSVPAVQAEKSSWKIPCSLWSQSEGSRSSAHNQSARQNTAQETSKPASENSLRILTAVIGGMRHWSHLKDRVPHLLEIFATLDSAVTLGQHGAKNFLMRDGKEVVQCIFYENEQALPRLIRGQIHRCVGNYDRRRDVLTCVSVRPGLPSELRDAQDAVKVCDAEMRALLKSLSEV